MPKHAKLFLNKVINEQDAKALLRHDIKPMDMPTQVEKDTLNFITNYAESNGGYAPSYALVASSVPNFEYIPDVTDSFTYLARQIKSFTAKRYVMHLFETGEFEKKLNGLDGLEFIGEWLPNVLETAYQQTNVHTRIGIDIKSGADRFIDEYERRKEGDSFNVWNSEFSAIGEYISGNMYTIIGESGRGKSVITLRDVVGLAKQGATVLVWSLEMGWYEVMVRLYTMLSGDAKVTRTIFEGVEIDAGFDSNAIRKGELSNEFEKGFVAFLRNINDYVPGNIIIRSVDEEGFTDRSLKALERDIEKVEPDVVVIDPFYYLDYERNTSKTAGGDAANTSQRLRALTGRRNIVTIAITQSELSDGVSDEETGARELRIPQRDEVKKTKALLEDAAGTFGIDSDYKQGQGIIGNLKGRDGGEGDISNVFYLPQYGIIEEQEVGEDAVSNFDF